MDDAYESTLRQRFAQAESLPDDEGFVVQFRLRRSRVAQGKAFLRRLFIGLLLLMLLFAVRMLLPSLSRGYHEVWSQVTRLLQGSYSTTSLVWPLAIVVASALSVWAWHQAVQRN